MAINIYKEKNLGADNTKNKNILLLILGFLLEKSVLKSKKKPVSKGFSYFKKGTLLLFWWYFLLGIFLVRCNHKRNKST